MSSSLPPYYILVSHPPILADQSAPTTASYTTFSHPTVEYHYADDLPHALLPQSSGEHVLVLDYDPNGESVPVAQSLSTELAVTGVKVTEAPGAVTVEEDGLRNNKIYVLETTSIPEDSPEDDVEAHAVLSRFKQRNAMLRAVLDYPQHVAQDTQHPYNGEGQPSAISPTLSTPKT
ncbi:hypothetical protein NM688_g4388 [Phlebia brevispora]|uniref:Uncharacterized protein n=1 Tax=Phlebia brevispora TaxID=194682 RepID=A0ACC1T303_9APHY|nr:hypothetical protein NM688_g4388 [Phlebia brevispora]